MTRFYHNIDVSRIAINRYDLGFPISAAQKKPFPPGRKGSPAVTVTQMVEKIEKDGKMLTSFAVFQCCALDIECKK